jgi:ribonuclease HI
MNNDIVNPPDNRHDTVLPLPLEVKANAWAVDAACSGNPGAMEYQGIDLTTGAQVFHFGPVYGTNNIGEFLAIVHALALMQTSRASRDKAIYSDSYNAILWVQEEAVQDQARARHTAAEDLYRIVEPAPSEWFAHPSRRQRAHHPVADAAVGRDSGRLRKQEKIGIAHPA